MASAGTIVSPSGYRIGRYAVTGRIGRGGMGLVYRGFDPQLERAVAIKTLTLETAPDAESRLRFAVEAKAAARLQHPNIVTVYELGSDRGLEFIAMELLSGADLDALARSQPAPTLAEKLDIVAQVCDGLAYAHECGIVHRDIKPSNVRVLDDGSVKLLDFGIAKLGSSQLTQAGMMVGTVHYMSPEQIRGAVLDGRSDLFSVGVILHELLAGARPFVGHEPHAVLYKIVHEEPERLSEAALAPLGSRLAELVGRVLAKDREARPKDAACLARELRELGATLAARQPPELRSQEEQSLQAVRELQRVGRADEALTRLRAAITEQPEALSLRRTLRGLERARLQPEIAEATVVESFPELERTFQAPSTERTPATEDQPTPSATPGPGLDGRRSRLLLIAGASVAAVLLVVSLVRLFWPAPLPLSIEVRSKPQGARVFVDGRDTGVATDGTFELPKGTARAALSLKRAGYRDATQTLEAPRRGQVVELELEPLAPLNLTRVQVESDPPGASVRLDGQLVPGKTPVALEVDPARPHRVLLELAGHRSQELALGAGSVPPGLKATLESTGPRGFVALFAPFPIDVALRGRVLVKGQSQVRVSLPAGRQTLNLTSARYFLKIEQPIDVPADGEAVVRLPALGRLNVRATPDNCEVFVNGSFVDYPPILDRPAAAGRLEVAFRWPDGARTQESVELEPAGVAFVTGRKP